MRVVAAILMMLAAVVQADEQTISEFVSEMDKREGFFTLFYDKRSGKLYLDVDRLGEQFLFQSSLPRGIGSNDIGLDRGQLGDTRLVAFERFGDKVLLRQFNTQYRISTDNPAEQASIDEAFADSVIAGLPIVADEQNRVLVDYTDFIVSDIHGVSRRLASREQGKFALNKAQSGVYLPRTKSFEDNTEIEALVTFTGDNPGGFVEQVVPDPHNISVHSHHSLIRLPDDSYQPRAFHPYSGFWRVGYQDYSVPIDAPIRQSFIPRHRLVKKNPDAEVSEAIEPIVYYLDPGIPEPVRTALYDGAMWWDQAFSAIGYQNAFVVKPLPAGADPMDVRYNVIQWVHRATRGWSYGSSVIDPRSGEIIKGHVTLGSLRVRQDYLIALGLTSPFDSENTDTSVQREMALARIRQLSAHEVGHTLGIAHNFAASANERASVMDYPHPKAIIERGQITLQQAYDDKIGRWDKHVIAYGYQDVPDPADEAAYLDEVISRAREQGLLYLSDPDARSASSANAVGHLWDNGADPLSELERIKAVRKLALENFGLNSLPNGASLSSLQETLGPVYLMHRYQAEAAVRLLGGVNFEYELKGDYKTPKGITPVDAQRQKRALAAMLDTASPAFLALPQRIQTLIPPKAYGERNTRESFASRTGNAFDSVSAAESAAAFSLALILQPQRLNRVADQSRAGEGYLSVQKVAMSVIDKLIKTEPTRIGRQVEDRIAYVAFVSLMDAVTHSDIAPEVQAELLAALTELQGWLKKQRKRSIYRLMLRHLERYLEHGEWQSDFAAKKLPPGSPI